MFKKLQRRLKKAQERLMANGFAKFLVRVAKEFGNDNGTNMAAAVAYYIFLSIFPLLLALIGALGLVLRSPVTQDQVFAFLRENIPGAADLFQGNLENIIALRGTLGIIGVAALLWTGSQVVASLTSAINRAWDITVEPPIYIKRPRDLVLTVAIGVLFLFSLVLGSVLAYLPVSLLPVVGSVFVQLGIRVIAFLLSFIVFLALFKFSPNTRTYWRHTWFGALVTAVLFEIGRNVAFLYLTNFGNYQMIYGSIASVIILLLWLYYSALIVIIGAELTAEYGRLRRGIGTGRPSHSYAEPSRA